MAGEATRQQGDLAELSLLASLPAPWNQGRLEPLASGLTNGNYRLHLPSGQRAFLRRGHPDPVRLGIDRATEWQLYQGAVGEGLALPCYHSEPASGLMLLAASPGGTTANLFSHLAHGDVALNITLTAVNSLIAILTMPLLVNLSLSWFMASDQAIPLQFAKVMQVFAIVLLPVALGMLIRHFAPAFAARMEKPMKLVAALFLAFTIVLALAKDWQTVVEYAPVVGLAALLFNLLSLTVGYWVPRLLSIPKRQAIAIGMEIGIHNGTLAIALALSPSLLNNATMAVPAALYSLIMFFTAAGFGWWVSRGHVAAEPKGETVN